MLRNVAKQMFLNFKRVDSIIKISEGAKTGCFLSMKISLLSKWISYSETKISQRAFELWSSGFTALGLLLYTSICEKCSHSPTAPTATLERSVPIKLLPLFLTSVILREQGNCKTPPQTFFLSIIEEESTFLIVTLSLVYFNFWQKLWFSNESEPILGAWIGNYILWSG